MILHMKTKFPKLAIAKRDIQEHDEGGICFLQDFAGIAAKSAEVWGTWGNCADAIAEVAVLILETEIIGTAPHPDPHVIIMMMKRQSWLPGCECLSTLEQGCSRKYCVQPLLRSNSASSKSLTIAEKLMNKLIIYSATPRVSTFLGNLQIRAQD